MITLTRAKRYHNGLSFMVSIDDFTGTAGHPTCGVTRGDEWGRAEMRAVGRRARWDAKIRRDDGVTFSSWAKDYSYVDMCFAKSNNMM